VKTDHAKIQVHFKVKQKMKISELAARAGVATSAIRYYESAQLLPKAERGANGYRSYDDTDLERIHFIQIGQKLGFSLDAIREVIALEGDALHAELMKRFDARLKDIDRMMQALGAQRAALLEAKRDIQAPGETTDVATSCGAHQRTGATENACAVVEVDRAGSVERSRSGIR
jgi:MerR family copper efflux transcriptional regulator